MLLANGVRGDITLEDAEAVLDVLVATGRAIPPANWVPWIGQRRAAKQSMQKIEGLF